MTQAFALIYVAFIAATIGFQIALICGAPLGRYTQGGQNEGQLPRRNRVFAGLSAILLCAMGCAVLSAAGVWPNWPVWTGWICLAVQAVSAILNWITPSRVERLVWGPVTLIMLVLVCLVMI